MRQAQCSPLWTSRLLLYTIVAVALSAVAPGASAAQVSYLFAGPVVESSAPGISAGDRWTGIISFDPLDPQLQGGPGLGFRFGPGTTSFLFSETINGRTWETHFGRIAGVFAADLFFWGDPPFTSFPSFG